MVYLGLSKNSAQSAADMGGGWKWLAATTLLVGPLLTKWIGEKASRLLDTIFVGSGPTKLGADGLSQVYKDISRLIRWQRGKFLPFVFFFDDIDRCQPDRIVGVLESVHSLTSAGCVVFLACDDDFVAASIAVHYDKIIAKLPGDDAKNFGKRFLEKVVQVSFRLPLVRNADIYELGLATRTVPLPQGTAVTPTQGSAAEFSSDNQAPTAARPEELALDSIKLRQIVSELLGETVEPLGLNIRQVKSITNSMKLYLEIDRTANEEAATRLAAFVLADICDQAWLDSHYAGTPPGTGPIAASPNLADRFRVFLGDDYGAMEGIYHLLGRRPPPRVAPISSSP